MNSLGSGGGRMQLEAILEQNRGFVRGREARPLPPPDSMQLAIVACYDPRLDALLPAALGIAAGEAFLLRSAGALLQPGSSALRSLGLAVYMFGVTDVIVVGHTSCRMATFESSPFIDAFRKRGVPREAFGVEDLRTWAGAIPDPQRGVALSIANILAAPFLPHDLSLAGLVLDDTTGALEVVVKPGEIPERAPPAADTRPNEISAPEAADEGTDPLLDAVQGFVRSLQSTQRWRDEVKQLRQQLERERNPLAKLGLLENVARKAAAESKDVREAFARVQREASTSKHRAPEELVRLFRQLTGGS